MQFCSHFLNLKVIFGVRDVLCAYNLGVHWNRTEHEGWQLDHYTNWTCIKSLNISKFKCYFILKVLEWFSLSFTIECYFGEMEKRDFIFIQDTIRLPGYQRPLPHALYKFDILRQNPNITSKNNSVIK